MKQLAKGARKLASRCLLPLIHRAAHAYVAGEHLADALKVANILAPRGLNATLGYWDSPENTPRIVADEYIAGVKALAGRENSYLSIKAPSLGFLRDLLNEVAQQARQDHVRLHFDAQSPEEADRSLALFDEFLTTGIDLSYTLPGRWVRSVRDAEWVAERGIIVRVVKGQWADPEVPHRDLREGFLDVIDSLAGKAKHVEVASHDVPLVEEAIRRLRGAGTSCSLELLYGLPMRQSLHQADRLALSTRIYVPYGKSYLPYALSRVRSNPRIAWWLLRDLFVTLRPVDSASRA